MNHSIWGNLNDWGTVLEKLEKLSATNELDPCQDELIRLLRFDGNWRLREAAIESLPRVNNPCPALLREVILLMKRKDVYYDLRILAADCLGQLCHTMVHSKAFDRDITRQFIQNAIHELDLLLDSPEPPKFSDVLETSRQRLKKIEAGL